MFLCTVDCQQSNLVICHNDTLSCSRYIVLIISSVSGNMNVMCIVIPATVSLCILCSLGAIIIAVIGLSEVQITKCGNSVNMYTGWYHHQSFWNKGLFSSSADVSGVFEVSTPCCRNCTVFFKLLYMY